MCHPGGRQVQAEHINVKSVCYHVTAISFEGKGMYRAVMANV